MTAIKQLNDSHKGHLFRSGHFPHFLSILIFVKSIIFTTTTDDDI